MWLFCLISVSVSVIVMFCTALIVQVFRRCLIATAGGGHLHAALHEHHWPKKSPEGTQSRWTQIIHAYGNIRQCVVNNACVMADTTIQLPSTRLPAASCSTRLPAASCSTPSQQRPAAPASQQRPHPPPSSVLQPAGTPSQQYCQILPAGPATASVVNVPKSTLRNRKRRMERELAGEEFRQYKKKTDVVQWISKALFQWSKTGQPELDFTRVDRMWWYPPQPSLVPTGIPPMERYFGHPLFLWMPRKLWRVRLLCPHEDCGKEELTSAGLHQRVRHVVGVSMTYFMVSEYLSCKGCKRKVISWTRNIIRQLDIGHQVQFPCLLTSKLGCDMQVVRQMRQRGLGNSSSQLQRQMAEQHAEVWLQKQLQFLTDCSGFAAGCVCRAGCSDGHRGHT
ncbi:hypothetical protein N1851_023343 [Merluccius polli]|uniref:DUF6729 domain-containing protein n=1 Tax=Merluccius polli TaxID=89951 RepID=A0AA47MGN8_MERPO|nr:hypothetical protein N1851_023343 [Merluccius polli]